MLRSNLPPGFRQASAASGLLVPEDTPREREVWTKDEARLMDRTLALLKSRGLKFLLACTDARCDGHRLEREVAPDGGYVLRCQHKERVFQRKH